jgi:hypothetical protein
METQPHCLIEVRGEWDQEPRSLGQGDSGSYKVYRRMPDDTDVDGGVVLDGSALAAGADALK